MASHDAEGHVAGTEVPGGPAHEEAFPPFDPTHFSSQLIWLAITFGAIYVLMSKIALPRVAGVFEARKAKISGDLDAAADLQKQAGAADAAHQKTLTDAKTNAQGLAQANQDTLAAETEARRKTLEAELNAKLAEAEAQIAQTKTAAMANVEGIATDAAHAIIQQITGKPADAGAVAAAVAALKA